MCLHYSTSSISEKEWGQRLGTAPVLQCSALFCHFMESPSYIIYCNFCRRTIRTNEILRSVLGSGGITCSKSQLDAPILYKVEEHFVLALPIRRGIVY
jgi:hypothetical protein